MATALIPVIEDLFRQPPIPYEPAKHSLKAWATYCLRDRGFKVVYAERADFAIESKTDGKVYFNVTTDAGAIGDRSKGWIVWDGATQSTQIIAPESAP